MATDSTARARTVRFGAFEADLSAGELRKGGVRIKLHGQPFEVLTMLLARPGELVTREELRQRLWLTETFVDFDHGVSTAVNRLREALGDSAENPRFIETVPRRGYRFIAPVDSQGSAGPGSNVSPAGTSSSRATPAGTQVVSRVYGRRALVLASALLLVLASALLLVLASALLVVIALVAVLSLSSVRERLFGRPSPPRIQSLAVLPLVNLSGDPNQDYFADGMTEALTTELGTISALRVISGTSVMQYKARRNRYRRSRGN